MLRDRGGDPAGRMARELLGNEDAMRQVLRRCSPEAVALFARTGAGPRALAAEEELFPDTALQRPW